MNSFLKYLTEMMRVMKEYNISAETSTRILKNWKIQAKDKSDALEQFKQKANIGEKTKLRNLKIIERGQEKI